MQTSEDTHTREALALLPLPALDGLTEAQVRGRDCVWCGIVLTAETAIDCGPRRKKHLGTAYDWFPRSCTSCTGGAALRALHDHAPACKECCAYAGGCDTGRILLSLIRDGHRANGSGEAFGEVLDRLTSPAVPCEPCLYARIFSRRRGDHGCTGVAAMQEDERPCPCCGKVEG